MKIVNKKEFYTLPSGTLYSKFEPYAFYGLKIKGETIYHGDIPADYNYQEMIGNVDALHSGEFIDILRDSEENRTSFDMDFNCIARDGLFEGEEMFAIYEKKDVEQMVDKLKSTIIKN